MSRTTNEGRCCDAIIRRIEKREGHTRKNITYPESEGSRQDVEITAEIGTQLFAIEHTCVEPFDGFFKLQGGADAYFYPISALVDGMLPPEHHFVLHIPVGALQSLGKRKRVTAIQAAIAQWILRTAPTLPVARRDSYVIDMRYQTVEGIPFEMALHRVVLGGKPGKLSIVHLVEREPLEPGRLERIRRAYDNKMPKLSAWKEKGARTVLILEENDVQMTNHVLVANAVRAVELNRQHLPDEIYLVSTAIDMQWHSWILRNSGIVYEELSYYGNSINDIDPTTLIDLTGR